MGKILLIDDDPSVRRTISKILAPSGHRILEARDGIEGLSIAGQEIPDLIICDYLMPDMNGLETLQLLRKEDSLKDIPVIVVTIETDKSTIKAFLKLGVSYFFAKPFDFGTLRKKVQQVLEVEEIRRKSSQPVSQAKREHKDSIGRSMLVICEPNETLSGKLVEVLGEDYEVVNVADGALCLKAALLNRPDAILINPDMPLLSGFELAKRIRSTPELKKTKVLIFSSRRNRGEVDEHSELFDCIIEKPYTTEQLLQNLKGVLNYNHYQVVESGKALIVKLDPGYLKWATENRDKAIDGIDEVLLEIFESGKTALVIDMTKTEDDEEAYLGFIEEVIDRISIQDIELSVVTGFYKLKYEMIKRGLVNVRVIKPSYSPA